MEFHIFDIIVAIVITVIGSSGIWAFIGHSMDRAYERKSTAQKGLTAVTQYILLTQMRKFIYRKAISTSEKETLHELLVAYEEIGGDGVVHTMVKTCDNLYVVSDEEAEKMDAERRYKFIKDNIILEIRKEKVV